MPILQMNSLNQRIDPESVFRSFGIYAIQNNINERVYIGFTAKSFIWRWRRHRVDLRMGHHSRPELQADWSAGGDSIFTCAILETATSVDDLEPREEHYIVETAREMGVRQLYNSLHAIRSAREEFNVVTRLSKKYGFIQEYLD